MDENGLSKINFNYIIPALHSMSKTGNVLMCGFLKSENDNN